MNQALLVQKRKGIQDKINKSPEAIIIYRKPMTDNGFGDLVEDPYGTPVPYNVRCRLSHEQEGPQTQINAPSGLSTALVRFILVDHKTTIYENDTFEALGKKFRIGVVDPLKKFNGILGYQAPLYEAEDIT